ncbi:COMM domain-containing protein 5 [Phlebotomus papatasi]|uniref:COMM domain-containing protein 5 n=1 Tax=Phlebotomus papatasi TaxID=29031 RepID=UPI002483ADB7|nr:COMM domain-containing protein 5 [Phlebotomus papatasi]
MWNFNESNSLNSIKNSTLQKSDVKILVQLAVNYIDSQNCPLDRQIAAKNRISNSSSTKLSNSQFAEVFATVLSIIREYLRRTPRDSGKKDILRSLLQEHKFPEDCIEEVCNTLWKHRDLMLQKYYALKTVNVAPTITWRINISMLEDTQTRISEPTIVLEVKYPDGRSSAFEISRFMFHRLRFSVSQLLKSMHTIETKAIVKN